MEFIIKGLKDFDIKEEAFKVLKEDNWNWNNFKEGDVVYMESLTKLKVPNLVIQDISKHTVVLKVK